jgi:branched-chain amino acid transport system ATP-binding protein
MAELTIEKVSKRFGGLLAVEKLDLKVPEGKILSLIGPNGAGKTTVFNMVTGVYPPTEGAITFKGHKLNSLRSSRIIAHGIARTFQNIRLFKSMTVLENVQVGMHCRTRSGAVRALLKTRFEKQEEKNISEKAFEILEYIGLKSHLNDYASSLPYGEQRRLEIARALATQPEILLLDEPAAGMNPKETAELMELIIKLRDTGLTIFLVEHDMRLVLNNWDSLTAGPNGLFGMKRPVVYYPAFEDGGFTWLTYYLKSLPALYYLILVIAIFIIIGVRRLDNSRIGRAWIAIREDEVAAELSGVPTTWIKLLAYALGAAFASVAGAFFAAKLSYTNPNFFLFMESCIVLCIVVLGGVGSIPGIIVAGFVLIAVPEAFRGLETYRMLAFGAIMTIMMIIKPDGLIPASRRRGESHETNEKKPREKLGASPLLE